MGKRVVHIKKENMVSTKYSKYVHSFCFEWHDMLQVKCEPIKVLVIVVLSCIFHVKRGQWCVTIFTRYRGPKRDQRLG